MTKPHAAYELGFNAVMVRYGLVYLWKFGCYSVRYQSSDDLNGGVEQPLRRLDDCVDSLGEFIPDGIVGRSKLRQLNLQDLGKRLVEAQLKGEKWHGSYIGSGVCPGLSTWQDLSRLVDAMLKGTPRLDRWRRLGESLAFCLLQILLSDKPGVPPDIMPVFTAAAQMPEPVLQRIPALQKCALAATAIQTAPQLQQLAQAVGQSVDTLCPAPNTMMRLVRVLDDAIVDGFGVLPAVDLVLDDSDRNHCQALLDDRAYEIEYAQFLFLKALRGADGQKLRGQDLVAREPNFKGIRLDRLHKGLPKPIQDLIQADRGHGGGYRLKVV